MLSFAGHAEWLRRCGGRKILSWALTLQEKLIGLYFLCESGSGNDCRQVRGYRAPRMELKRG